MSKRSAGGVIHNYVGDDQIRNSVDAHELNRRVLEIKTRDDRAFHRVCVEELGLGLASVSSLSVPPSSSASIDDVPCRSDNSDVSPRNRD